MKKRCRKSMVVIAMVIVGIFSLCTCGSSSDTINEREVIRKLQEFTTMKQEGNSYVFESNGEWSLHYTTENEFVEIHQEWIKDCFSNWFGDNELGNDGTFKYDLDENIIGMYFDYESAEGALSIISYNIDEDKFSVNFDGKRYEATDEFAEYIMDYGLIEVLQNSIEEFKSNLESNNVSIVEVTELRYKDIVDNISLDLEELE